MGLGRSGRWLPVLGPDDEERWRTELSAHFAPMDLVSTADDGHLSGEVATATGGALVFGQCTSHSLEVHRSAAAVRRGDPGGIKVTMQLDGTGILTQGDRDAVLRPGDFTVYDSSRPYAMRYPGCFAMFVLMFPRESVGITHGQLEQLSAVSVRGAEGIGAGVSQLLRTLRDQLTGGGLASTAPFEDAVFDLVAAAAATRAGMPTTPRETLLRQARSYITGNLADPGLDTASIAAAVFVSPRVLQRAFAAEGWTIGGWIRRRRLEMCRRDLEDDLRSREDVSTIAARYGLTNPAHFSRIFKEAYGLTPSAFRLRAGGVTQSDRPFTH
ncbi:AraC-like ligand-binding domain-containing protein [Mycolicibacterium mageritense]